MSYDFVYTCEDNGDDSWSIFNDTTVTGHPVLHPMASKEAAEFYTDMMNEVYNQIKRDVEKGYIKYNE